MCLVGGHAFIRDALGNGTKYENYGYLENSRKKLKRPSISGMGNMEMYLQKVRLALISDVISIKSVERLLKCIMYFSPYR